MKQLLSLLLALTALTGRAQGIHPGILENYLEVAQPVPLTLDGLTLHLNSMDGDVTVTPHTLRLTPLLGTDDAGKTILNSLTISLINASGQSSDIVLARDKFPAIAYVYGTSEYIKHGFGLLARGADGTDVVMTSAPHEGSYFVHFMRGSSNFGMIHEAMSLELSREQNNTLARYLFDELLGPGYIMSGNQEEVNLYPPGYTTTATEFDRQRMDMLLYTYDSDWAPNSAKFAAPGEIKPLVVDGIDAYYGGTEVGKMQLTIAASRDEAKLTLTFTGAIGNAVYTFDSRQTSVIYSYDLVGGKEVTLGGIDPDGVMQWISFASPTKGDGRIAMANVNESMQVSTGLFWLRMTPEQYTAITDYLSDRALDEFAYDLPYTPDHPIE